jgi:hypothetical protein
MQKGKVMDNSKLARDQYGEPWILFDHAGSTWALGLDIRLNTTWPMIRYAGEARDVFWTIHTELHTPRGIRNLVVMA